MVLNVQPKFIGHAIGHGLLSLDQSDPMTIGKVIKRKLDTNAITNSPEVIGIIICSALKVWEESGSTPISPENVKTTLMTTEISRDQFIEAKMHAFTCLEIPAVRNLCFKVKGCCQIDLSKHVPNDNSAFEYKLITTTAECAQECLISKCGNNKCKNFNFIDTKGEICFTPLHPPCRPLVRYTPVCDIDRDSFMYKVTNKANGLSVCGTVFLVICKDF